MASILKLLFLTAIVSSIPSVKSFLVSNPNHSLIPAALSSPPSGLVATKSLLTIMSTPSDNSSSLADPSTMKIREIKNELDDMNIKYNDCFDKESLCTRLVDGRSGKVKGVEKTESTSSKTAEAEAAPTATPPKSSNFDKAAKKEELRSLRVKELRTKCAQFNIRWAHMIEKDELVNALADHYEKCSDFSPSGTLMPGKVSTITDDSILDKEINSGTTTAPLMLDVFATWCGPCKLMAPQLDDAALELGDAVRVAKIDSDQHPEWSSKLNVNGLPTIIVFDGMTGKELQRVEGALMKDDLIKLARSHSN
jgi:thioredoxin